MSLRLEVRNRMLRELVRDLPPDVPMATTRRWVPGDEAMLPAISVWLAKETAVPVSARTGGARERKCAVVTQCIAAGDVAAEVEELVEPLAAFVVSRLGDTTFDGLVHSLQEDETIWEVPRAEQLYVVCSIVWIATYHTIRNDLAAR